MRLALIAMALAAAGLAAAHAGGCDARRDVRTIKLAHGLSPSHPVHQAMQHMADRVAEKSSGELRMGVRPLLHSGDLIRCCLRS